MAIEKLYAIAQTKGYGDTIPYIFVSSDDGANWNNNTFAADFNFARPADYRVKPDNQNMVLFANFKDLNNPIRYPGLSYSTDACVSVTTCGGDFNNPSYNQVYWNWIHICPADPNIVWAISHGPNSYGNSGTIIAKSTDGGFTFNVVNTGNNIDGFTNTTWSCIFSPNGATVVIAIDTDVYLSTDNGANFNYVATAPPSGVNKPFSNVYTDDTGSTIYAATTGAVFKYDSAIGGFQNIYTYPSGEMFEGVHYIALEYINPTTFYFSDSKNLFETSDGFASVNQRLAYLGGKPTYLRPSFYNYSTGYYIDGIKPTGVFKTSDAGVSGSAKGFLIATTGSEGSALPAESVRVAREMVTGCGCPEGSVYNEETGLCDTTTNVCPEGSTWNPVTEVCEVVGEPCLLDLTIIIDQSGSITEAEQTSLKSLLYNIVDGIQDNGGANRITSDNVRIGLVTFSNTGANLLNLAGGAGSWTPAPTGGTIKTAIAGLPASPIGRTAAFDGLRSGYLNLTGVNSRNGVANKKILFVTDGWANYTNGVSFNGISPGIGTSDNTCPYTPENGNDQNRCSNAAWTANKRQNYTATMDLAESIKTGTGPDMIVKADITLVVLGAAAERAQVIGAYVGGLNVTVTDANVFPNVPFPSSTTASLTNTTYFSVCQWYLATNGPSAGSGSAPTPITPYVTSTYCQYYDAWYPEDGTGGKRFPSNNAVGGADYFDATFDSAATIASSIVNSALSACTEEVPATACSESCVFDPLTGNCTCSADTFNPCCYDLLDCKTGIPLYTVNTYALGYDPLADYVGQVITIEGTQECLFLEVTDNCTNTTPFPLDSALNIIPYENGCQECEQAQGSNPCYKLINCDNQNVLYTRLNLASYVGKTVTLNEYPEMCWQVLQSNICPGPFVYITLGPDTYKDCECCAQYHCN